jgi:transposase InsO family protein
MKPISANPISSIACVERYRFCERNRKGRAAEFCHGGCRSQWMPHSASRHWKALWLITASPKFSIRTRGLQFTGSGVHRSARQQRHPISMDGKGAWQDNVFVKRLWRSVKYAEVYLRAYESVSEARNSIGRYLDFYNRRRPHSSHDGSKPDQAYFASLPIRLAA